MAKFTIDGQSFELDLTEVTRAQLFAILPNSKPHDYHMLLSGGGCPDLMLGDEPVPLFDGASFETFPRGQWGG